MPHTHIWKRSPRKHGRPPRFFVVCDCGEKRQAVIHEGYMRTFTTNSKKPWAMKNYSIRLTPSQYADVLRWKREGWPKT